MGSRTHRSSDVPARHRYPHGTQAARLIPLRRCAATGIATSPTVFRHPDLLNCRLSTMNQDPDNNEINVFIVILSKCRQKVSQPGASAGPRHPADVVLTGMGVRPLTNPSVLGGTLALITVPERVRRDIAEWRSS